MVIFLHNLSIFVWTQHSCLANTVFALDPSNSVIKRLSCTFGMKKKSTYLKLRSLHWQKMGYCCDCCKWGTKTRGPSWPCNAHLSIIALWEPDLKLIKAWLVQEKKRKIDFQDGPHGGHLGFPIGTILAIFDLQVTPMLPSNFGVNWPLGSREEAKNRFSRWWPFLLFFIYKSPWCSYQVLSQVAQGCRRSRLLKQLLTPHTER